MMAKDASGQWLQQHPHKRAHPHPKNAAGNQSLHNCIQEGLVYPCFDLYHEIYQRKDHHQ
jgi:hypothetical protein